jgi:hypothetical protein
VPKQQDKLLSGASKSKVDASITQKPSCAKKKASPKTGLFLN